MPIINQSYKILAFGKSFYFHFLISYFLISFYIICMSLVVNVTIHLFCIINSKESFLNNGAWLVLCFYLQMLCGDVKYYYTTEQLWVRYKKIIVDISTVDSQSRETITLCSTSKSPKICSLIPAYISAPCLVGRNISSEVTNSPHCLLLSPLFHKDLPSLLAVAWPVTSLDNMTSTFT
jgi:hypothetical protein